MSSKDLPSIDDFSEDQSDLPSIDEFITEEVEEDLPSVEDFIEKEKEIISEQTQTIEDANGRTNLTVDESNCATVFENTFDPWIAEPTDVSAEYIGNALTRVTWTDQIGVEGEIYNIWRSNSEITNIEEIEHE